MFQSCCIKNSGNSVPLGAKKDSSGIDTLCCFVLFLTTLLMLLVVCFTPVGHGGHVGQVGTPVEPGENRSGRLRHCNRTRRHPLRQCRPPQRRRCGRYRSCGLTGKKENHFALKYKGGKSDHFFFIQPPSFHLILSTPFLFFTALLYCHTQFEHDR